MPFLKAVDGSDLVLYRGERTSPDINGVRSRLPSIYFGDAETANVYSLEGHFLEAPRIYPAKLVMKRPFINQPNDPFINLSDMLSLVGFSRAWDIAFKYAELIEQTDNWCYEINANNTYTGVRHYLEGWPNNALGKLYFQAWPFFEDWENIRLLMSLGFDGAIHAGSGCGSAGKPEYCVFDKAQIHYLFN